METETFQHYRVLRRVDGGLWELGRGAMAVTYKAFDVNLQCPVALKVIGAHLLGDEHTRARFVREARAAAGLRHRNIATVFHLGSDEQSYFYAMEFVDGETVEDLVARRGPLPPAEALEIAAQVARALGAAARQGLVHRDIKPANLMVVREDEDDATLVKVIDFGLARRGVTDPAAQITLSGFVGTPQYASPEQIEERDLDSRSDIYSLGVTLWFMLTGRPTFTGPAGRIGSQHLHDEPPWPTVAHLPVPVRTLLASILQKRPNDRPADPAALRHKIAECLQALAEGDAATDTPPPAPPAANPAEAETVAPATPLPVPEGAPPAVGDVLAGRYTLLASIGEGRGGQVFRAGDGRRGGRIVAVKSLRNTPGAGGEELGRLQGEFRRLRAAPHPGLIEALTFDETHGHWFVASEWVDGFTLVDLLRHRGCLGLPDALRLLAPASDAAAHGRANGLHRLELAPHQILVHLPTTLDDSPDRAILDLPLAKWPRFSLKIDALAPPHGTGDCAVNSGSLTLVSPGSSPTRTLFTLEDGYVRPLGALLYELLSGTPPPAGHGSKRELPPLPALGEQANKLLQRALSPQPDFHGEQEFFEALLAACHLARSDVEQRSGPFRAAVVRRTTNATLVPGTTPTGEPPSTLPMAPRIRTRPLRTPSAPVRVRNKQPADDGGRSRRARRLVIIVVTALIAIGIGAALLLRVTW